MDKVLPLFKSHYSIGRSILTLHPKGSSDGVGPDSIIDICADSGLKELYLVDDSMTGFMEAYHNASEVNIDLRFGLRINTCEDISKKDKEALKILGLKSDTNWSDIQKKFKTLVKKYHPDKNRGSKKYEDILKKITLAYSQLKVSMRK